MKKHFLIFTISLLFFSLAQGKVKLPAMMGDHMVLQQNTTKGHGIRRYKRGNVSIKQDSQDNLPILFRPMKRPK